MVPVSTKGFKFPGTAYYSTVLPSLFGEDADDAERTMRGFFEQIAIPLSTHASDSTLRAECSQILTRLPPEEVKKDLGREN
eukprot:2987557-Amphidinium_carterae.1